MTRFPSKLQKKLEKRAQENAFRTLIEPNDLIDFSSNDYLGFSKESTISDSAIEIINTNGVFRNGATGSRLLSGNHNLYSKTEKLICEFHNSEAALVFNSGYSANMGFFSTVPQKGYLILFDELCHASIREGIQLSNSKSYKFKHNDVNDLLDKVDSFRSNGLKNESEIFVVTESVFSMDGDSPDLSQLAIGCQENRCLLIVDEAHALGVYPKGLVQELMCEEYVFARIMTFGKALGTHGAAVLGGARLRDFLVNFCKSFIYTTGLPPHTLATILAAYRYLESEKGKKRIESLKENIEYFNQVVTLHGLRDYFLQGESAIQICKLGGNDRVKSLSQSLKDEGFDVRPILSPTVPVGHERLRICLHAFNTKNEIDKLLGLFKKELLDEK